MSEISADQIDKEVLPFLSIAARPDLKCIAMQVSKSLITSGEIFGNIKKLRKR